MCGIAGGIWLDSNVAIDEPTLRAMTAVLAHRGPDDSGIYHRELTQGASGDIVPGVGLGHRRLSIIDLAGGRQPMANEEETIWVVFNGEIYNYPSLRRRLEGAGHRFRTQSDTETILHLYETEGLDCFRHLKGMFALAIWDRPRRRLLLARDRLGQKPLHYRWENRRLLFASELKALLEIPGLPRQIDPAALDAYMTYQYVPHPQSIFRGFRKLPPASYAVYEKGRLDVRQYWKPDFSRERPQSIDDACEQLRKLLNDSVEMRMQSDVPLGAFLSGGVDSSLIAALMTQMQEEPVRTFSIGFGVKEYDETAHAQHVADCLGTEHQTFQVDSDAVAILPQLAWHFDEPFADSSALPTWYLSQKTKQEVSVALTGDGSDELFAGYPRYQAVALSAKIDHLPMPSLLRSGLWKLLPDSVRQKSMRRRARKFGSALAMSPRRRYLEWISIFNEQQRAAIYTDDFLESMPNTDPATFMDDAWRSVGGRDPVTTASLTDLVTYLPCDLMTKVDIASMAHGLECRQPFLDHRLVEWAASLPIQYKRHRCSTKWILRKTFGPMLPDAIWRRRKMGFGVPLDHWFRKELRDMTHDLLLDGRLAHRNIFRDQAVRTLVEQHQRGQFDHGYQLWSLIMLELWMRRWIDDQDSL